MRKLQYILLAAALSGAAACTEYDRAEFAVAKTDNLLLLEPLNAYGDLKTHVDRTTSPAFQLGSFAVLSDFVEQTPRYRMIHTNFDEITPSTDMFHGSIVANNGAMNLMKVEDWMNTAGAVGTSIFGHALVSNNNQNAIYLNSTIAPIVIPSENNLIDEVELQEGSFKGWELVVSGGVIVGQPGSGMASHDGIEVTVNRNNVPWVTSLQGPTIPADPAKSYYVAFNVKSSGTASLRLYFDKTRNNYPAAGLVRITEPEVWKRVTLQVPERIPGAEDFRFFIDFGYNGGAKFSVDATSFTVKEGIADPNDNSNFVEKNETERRDIIDDVLNQYIAGVMETTATQISSWNVVDRPMDDTDPSRPATGEGKILGDTEFYWQDHLGEYYMARAVELARKAYADNGGTAPLKLFVNETGLLDNPAKSAGLIAYLQKVETDKGVKIDGIGTEIKAICGVNSIESIRTLFQTLAASGKLIRVSRLEVGYRQAEATADAPVATLPAARQNELADYYEAIVGAYNAAVPAGQRAGITLANPVDDGTSAGLWISGYPNTRRPAYAGVADGLKGN
jgi:GH35 family endo-1,4-beta-xylanase